MVERHPQASLEQDFEVRTQSQVERDNLKIKHEASRLVLKRSLDARDLFEVLDRFSIPEKYGRRCAGGLVRAQERTEMEAGVLRKTEIED